MLKLPSGHACVPERRTDHTVKVVILWTFVRRMPTKQVSLPLRESRCRGRVAEVPISPLKDLRVLLLSLEVAVVSRKRLLTTGALLEELGVFSMPDQGCIQAKTKCLGFVRVLRVRARTDRKRDKLDMQEVWLGMRSRQTRNRGVRCPLFSG